MAGADIKHHGGEPAQLVRQVRNWFVDTVGVRGARSATVLWYQFMAFMAEFYEKRQADGFAAEALEMMPVAEFLDFAREWAAGNPPPARTPGD